MQRDWFLYPKLKYRNSSFLAEIVFEIDGHLFDF